jgi:transcriptional regulator with XRE-family HTH domain
VLAEAGDGSHWRCGFCELWRGGYWFFWHEASFGLNQLKYQDNAAAMGQRIVEAPMRIFSSAEKHFDLDDKSGKSAFYEKGAVMSERAKVKAKDEKMHETLADAETAERFIAEKHLGERIRRLRLKKSMGLVELGKHTGLSASFLSQLETGRVVPTLRNLARIAMVFSKDLSHFFESEPAALFRVHRKKERVRMPQTGVDLPTYSFESLGYMVPDRQMDPYYAEFVPLPEQVEPKAHMHVGFEFLYILAGELAVQHGGQETVLGAGDAAYFDASTSHSYRCVGDRPAEAVIVTTNQNPAGQNVPPRPVRPVTKNDTAE